MHDWFDHAARIVFTVGDDPRPVGQGRFHVLHTQEGEFVMLPERGSNLAPRAAEQLSTGAQLSATIQPPVDAELRNGMLKSAFLAASLHLGGIPNVRSAHETRAELVAVVNARSRADVVAGPRAASLRFYRTGAPRSGPPLALMRGRESAADYCLSLAGTILVDWPFPEIDPEHRSIRSGTV